MVAYAGLLPKHVLASDRLMCRIADLGYPNSSRLASYLTEIAGCPESKIDILPNATRAMSLLEKPSDQPAELPADVRSLRRPVGGVIDNIDWRLVHQSMELAPEYSWLFVGPVTKKMLFR